MLRVKEPKKKNGADRVKKKRKDEANHSLRTDRGLLS
jgi:hypothetical protein